MKLQVVNLGMTDYNEALDIQLKMLKLRQLGEIEDTLLLLEHYPVLTIGKSGSDSNVLLSRERLKEQGVSVYDVTRGGDVTYHGPGQIVGYPVLDLAKFMKDIKEFVRHVEDYLVRLLAAEYGIIAGRHDKYTGVWVGNEKIMAIGFAVKRWVTMHGFAFNVNTELDHFKWIVPCGITDKGVTSLEKLTGCKQDMGKVMEQVARYFCETFGYQPAVLERQTFLDFLKSRSVE